MTHSVLPIAASICLMISVLNAAVAQEAAAAQEAATVPTEFQYPLAVVAAPDGVVYVADRNLPGIWKVVDGQKSVYFQGSRKFRTPLNAIRCLAIDSNGKLLAGDSATRDVYRFGDDGQPVPLTAGAIGIPMAIAVGHDGTIYVADLELHRIWKMPAEGSKQPTDVANVIAPRGLTIDAEGTLWVLCASEPQGQIVKIAADGKIEPFVKGQPFNMPHNLVRADDGTIYVSDNYQHCIWKVSADGQAEQWVAGAPLDRPVGLCRSGENLLIADPHIRTIFSLAPDKSLTVLASSPIESAP